MTWTEIDVPCSTVALPDNWDEYLKGLAPRFRTKVRSVIRALQARDDVQFEFCRSVEQLDEYLPALYDLHRRRWAKAAKPGVFGMEGKKAFYRAISEATLARGELFLTGLRWRGRLLACQYGFVYGNSYVQLQEGYEPESEHWNLGAALRAWSIQQLIGVGIREYDFLAGTGRHKSDWGATIRIVKSAKMARANSAGFIYCRAPEWIVAVRQAVKGLVPPETIAARDARQERRRVETWRQKQTQDSNAVAVPDWLRSAAAGAYFYSPLFRIAPSIRDNYRLRLSPRPCLERRSRPSLRILYFHRINDDKDPFRPSMPTSKFEEQIRMVAKHHRVVRLREAIRQLSEGGPAESLVVITFDDGYADNYTNALPVLERHGLPATIFLTTGSLDSRESMWFEKLAVAVKRSPAEFVDLELDVPRRLSLRSESDRLAANATIFAYLRTLADSNRRLVLTETLAKLKAPPQSKEQSEMLTWNQVREMRARRIDFGGHTVSHPFVSKLEPLQAEREVAECKRRIEEELQAPADFFAYPSGRESDFTPLSKEIVARAGYRAAVSTLWGVNFPDTDPMELRRGQPWEEHLSLFAAKLDWYQLTDT
jgi:peptidoglycan/xylan/chitin deacetylase (PgdA/CDA1 family)